MCTPYSPPTIIFDKLSPSTLATHTFFPSKAKDTGPLPTSNLPKRSPVSDNLITLLLPALATHTVSPSNRMSTGPFPTLNSPNRVPSRANLVTESAISSSRGPLFAIHMLPPSKARAIGRIPTSYSATIWPSPFSFWTVLPSEVGDPKIVTQTCSPSNASPEGPSPTPNVPNSAPSLDIFVTESSVGLTTHKFSPSNVIANGELPASYTPSSAPSPDSLTTLLPGSDGIPSCAIHKSSPSKRIVPGVLPISKLPISVPSSPNRRTSVFNVSSLPTLDTQILSPSDSKCVGAIRPKSNFSTLGGMSPDSTIGIGVGVAYAPPQPNPTKIVIKANVANARYLLTFIYVEDPLIRLTVLAPILYTLAPLIEQMT